MIASPRKFFGGLARHRPGVPRFLIQQGFGLSWVIAVLFDVLVIGPGVRHDRAVHHETLAI